MMKRSQKKTRANRPFSLLEICMSISVLGFLATVLSWGTHDLIKSHQYESGVKTLALDLRKFQSLAVSHQTEFDVSFEYNKGKRMWEYTAKTDEPLPFIKRAKATPLPGVRTLKLGTHVQHKPFILSISSTGTIAPEMELGLVGKKEERTLDWTASPRVTLQVGQ